MKNYIYICISCLCFISVDSYAEMPEYQWDGIDDEGYIKTIDNQTYNAKVFQVGDSQDDSIFTYLAECGAISVEHSDQENYILESKDVCPGLDFYMSIYTDNVAQPYYQWCNINGLDFSKLPAGQDVYCFAGTDPVVTCNNWLKHIGNNDTLPTNILEKIGAESTKKNTVATKNCEKNSTSYYWCIDKTSPNTYTPHEISYCRAKDCGYRTPNPDPDTQYKNIQDLQQTARSLSIGGRKIYLPSCSDTVYCPKGTHYNSNDCKKCSAGYYCKGGSTTDAKEEKCPAGTTSDSGATAKTKCYIKENGTVFKDSLSNFQLPVNINVHE